MLGAASAATNDQYTVQLFQSSAIDCLVAFAEALHRRTVLLASGGGVASPLSTVATASSAAASVGASVHQDSARRRQGSVSVLSLCHALFVQSKALLSSEVDIADGVRLLSAVLPLLSRASQLTGCGRSGVTVLPSAADGGRGNGAMHPDAQQPGRAHGETAVRECLGVLAEAVNAHMGR